MQVSLTVFAVGCALAAASSWICARWRKRMQARRLLAVLEAMSEQRPEEEVRALVRGETVLSDFLPGLERLAAAQSRMLQRAEQEKFSLKTVLSSMEEGVLVVDERQVIRLANPAFVAIFALERSPLERSVLEVLGEPDVHRLLREVFERSSADERTLRMVPGKQVSAVSVRAVPMCVESGRPGVLAVFRDVTRLQKLEQVRKDFVANVSHELRTPLTIFQGYVENLMEIPEMSEEQRSEIYAVLLRHSKRLNALVEELLQIARMEARREEFIWEELDLARVVQQALREWEVRAAAQGVEVAVTAEENLPGVRIDRFKIEQVLRNLLENALRHAPSEGGRVVVRVESLRVDDGEGMVGVENSQARGAEGLVVRVEDNGLGIAPRDLPHIFERFYRADRSRRSGRDAAEGSHGTGLGLSIVKHIVLAHGGRVGAGSPPGQGARVWFWLPLPPPEASFGQRRASGAAH